MQKVLFQINDYLRIPSLDFVQGLGNLKPRMVLFSKDVYHWERECFSEEGKVLGEFFSKKPITIKENALSIEVPKEVAENVDEQKRLILEAFGDGSAAGALKFQTQLYNLFDIDFDVPLESVKYSLAGRTMNVTFSSKVTLKNELNRLTVSQLENGIEYVDVGGEMLFQLIQEMVLVPGSVDLFYGGGHKYAIKTSSDISILKRKFRLAHRDLVDLNVNPILKMVKTFGKDDVAQEAGCLIRDSYPDALGGEEHYEGLFPKDFFLKLSDVRMPENVAQCIDFADSLLAAYHGILDEYEAARKGMIKSVGLYVESKGGTIQIDKSFQGNDFAAYLDRMCRRFSEELKRLNIVRDFLKSEVLPVVEAKMNCSDALLEYIFLKLQLDPQRYCEDRIVYGEFAKALIV